MAKILACLIQCRREHRAATKDELILSAYPDHGDEPPIGGGDVVIQTIQQARKRLQKMGWDVVGPKTTGHGYMLVSLERNL